MKDKKRPISKLMELIYKADIDESDEIDIVFTLLDIDRYFKEARNKMIANRVAVAELKNYVEKYKDAYTDDEYFQIINLFDSLNFTVN